MRLAVYCAQSWRYSTWAATGTLPITSPPVTAKTLDIRRLAAPLVYIRLHGMPGQSYLYGDPGWITALTTEQVRAADWSESIIMLEGCYGNDMAAAFLESGARAVVGCNQVTWGRRLRLGPSSQIGRAWLNGLRRGKTVFDALSSATRNIKRPFSDGWFVDGDKNAVYKEQMR